MRRSPLASLSSLCLPFALPVAAVFVYACSASSATSGFDTDGGGDGGSGADGSSSSDGGANDDAISLGDSALSETGTPGKTILYAHTNRTLFSVDAKDPLLALTKIGDFDCTGDAGTVSSLTDIAVDKDGKLYGVSPKTIFLDMTVNASSVGCTGKGVQLPAAGNFYGASFAPAGTVDPNAESLVIASSEGLVFKVDTTSGALTPLGTLGTVPADDGRGHTYAAANVGKAWELSGDIVFLSNNGSPVGFATVRDCPNPDAGSTTNCDKTDTLIEIDMSKLKPNNTGSVLKSVRGLIVKAASCNDAAHTGYGSTFGIVAYQGDIIGYARERSGTTELSLTVRINNNDGTACLVADNTALAPGGWAGAGVTTTAPVIVPPPR